MSHVYIEGKTKAPRHFLSIETNNAIDDQESFILNPDKMEVIPVTTSNEVEADYYSLLPLVGGALVILAGGTTLGLVLPPNPTLPTPWYRKMSSIIGYTYFLCWSSSFYPQILMNARRQTTRGLSVDFASLNVLGYVCYTTYTAFFFWNARVQEIYKDRMGEGSEVTVQSNDVAFALHALIMSTFTLGQIWYYDSFRKRPLSATVVRIFYAISVLCAGCIILILVGVKDWLDFLYLLSFVKLCVTLMKYIPQCVSNLRRQSTVGWNIWSIFLDLSGGILSMMQLLGDSADLKSMSGVTGNLAKIGLGFITILFDLIFIVQHYALYPGLEAADRRADAHERTPLL